MSAKYKITIRQTDDDEWSWAVHTLIGVAMMYGHAPTAAEAREAAERWCDREARTFTYVYDPDPEAYSE